MSFVVIKTSKEDFKENTTHQISWYHVGRKQYELAEITQFSGRNLDSIKKEYKDAFIEDIYDSVPVSYKQAKDILERPDVLSKPVPKKEVEESKFRCSDCQLGSASVGGIRRHITKMHGKGKANVVDIATGEIIKEEPEEVITTTTVFSASIKKDNDVKSESNSEKTPEEKALPYRCDVCSMSAATLGGIRRHITKIHGKGKAIIINASTGEIFNLVEEVNDDAPPAFQIADEKAKEAVIEEPPKAEVPFIRPRPVRRDF